MRDYIILTDSCCDLPHYMVEDLGIRVLPLSFLMEGKEYFNYSDNRDISPLEFYNKLRSGSLGTTSAVSIGAFQEVMSSLAKEGKDILCISVSSALSTTYQSASIAAGDVMAANPGCTIAVVDSLAASMGLGLLVYLAAQERRKGVPLEDVRRFAEEKKNHICHFFTVNDLNHLKRGGRLSATAALLGTMLQMKPVLRVDNDGRLTPDSKVRGRKASIQALLQKMEDLVETPSPVFISHGDCLEEAESLGRAIEEKFGAKTMVIDFIGPVIGNHAGPGTIALFFQGKHK